ncbi:MAG: HEAT repeat domain-containing protein [Candidatus Omnitrophota bacterium]
MHNYHADLIWKIDKALLSILFLSAAGIFFYALLQTRSERLRGRKLSSLKRAIFELIFSDGSPSLPPPAASNVTTEDFLDIVTNRNIGIAFFNEAEQERLKDYFVNQKNVLRLERVAGRSLSKWRRIEAMLALGYAGASSAMGIFEKAMFGKDPDISYFALIAMGQIKTGLSARILLAALKKYRPNGRKIAALLETFPPSIAVDVITLADDDDPAVRFWGMKILSRLKPAAYIEKIKNVARNDESDDVRAMACECLGAIGGDEAVKAILDRAKDGSWLVRASVAKALYGALGEKSYKYLAGFLSDNSLNVIEAAKDILMRNVEAALPCIEDVLDGKDGLAKRVAVEILARTGYMDTIVKNALSKEASASSEALILLAGAIKTGAHFSIESAALKLDAAGRDTLLDMIRGMDKNFAGYLHDRLRGLSPEL